MFKHNAIPGSERCYSRIIGTGGYLPSQVVTNQELMARVNTSDEWIVSRTGIRQRHFAASGEVPSDLALRASQEALKNAGLAPEALDLIIVATANPDMVFPSTACILQGKLGNKGAPAFDVQAVCCGFVYALSIADQMIQSGTARNALVVGVELCSRMIDWSDRTTCVLFGDGAGAVVLQASDQPGILKTKLHADGSYADILHTPGCIAEGKVVGDPFIRMDGGQVFRFAVKALAEVAQETLDLAEKTVEQVDWLIPHQANLRIIEATAEKLALPMEKVIVTVGEHANTSAASIPLALHTGIADGRIRQGQWIMLVGIGGGFAWGAALLHL